MHKPLNQEFIHLTLLVRSVRCSLYGTTLYCIHTALDDAACTVLYCTVLYTLHLTMQSVRYCTVLYTHCT